jgi:hypothetical protein
MEPWIWDCMLEVNVVMFLFEGSGDGEELLCDDKVI